MLITVLDQYYVQVVGSVDNSFPAKIVPPCSPSVRRITDDDLIFPNCLLKASCLADNPIHSTPKDDPVALKAYAGPMSAIQVV